MIFFFNAQTIDLPYSHRVYPNCLPGDANGRTYPCNWRFCVIYIDSQNLRAADKWGSTAFNWAIAKLT